MVLGCGRLWVWGLYTYIPYQPIIRLVVLTNEGIDPHTSPPYHLTEGSPYPLGMTGAAPFL